MSAVIRCLCASVARWWFWFYFSFFLSWVKRCVCFESDCDRTIKVYRACKRRKSWCNLHLSSPTWRDFPTSADATPTTRILIMHVADGRVSALQA
jgi:hypothetical protein